MASISCFLQVTERSKCVFRLCILRRSVLHNLTIPPDFNNSLVLGNTELGESLPVAYSK